MSDQAIAPCPFCGEVEITVTTRYEDREFVMCDNCGATADSVDTLPERRPVDVWNTRAAQPECRTCDYYVKFEGCTRNEKFGCCTNGDKYIEAPRVVLWRTEP